MKEIVIISGKGGTGKTSLAASFAYLGGKDVIVADCDVDAADMHLLLEPDFKVSENFYSGELAYINQDACTRCGKCADVCYYGVIKVEAEEDNPKKQFPTIYKKYLCKGCGKCASVCPSKAIKLTGFKDIAPKIGEKVMVIGGGNAALDAARSTLRLGAKEVSILYRRSREEMPAEPDWEIDETEDEGVKLEYLVAPLNIIGDKKGHVKAIKCVRMKLLEDLDKSGRRKIKPIANSEFTIECDSIILAIGQEVDIDVLSKDVDLKYTPWSSKRVDPVSFPKNQKAKSG